VGSPFAPVERPGNAIDIELEISGSKKVFSEPERLPTPW